MSRRPRYESIELVLKNVPPVPAVVRYYDDFSESYSQVMNADSSDQWTIFFDSRRATLDFRLFDPEFRGLIKAWCSVLLAHLSPVSTEYYFARISAVPITQRPEESDTRPAAPRPMADTSPRIRSDP